MPESLVTIITPVYNGADYALQAWHSVLAQEHTVWEWLVVDNNSTDGGIEQLQALTAGDSRVRFFSETKQGAGAARNVALEAMRGDFFVFLDIDDQLTPASIADRLALFLAHPEVDVVDGAVEVYNADFSEVVRTWRPAFSGVAFDQLLVLNPACFFGPTWMVRSASASGVRCSDAISHCEDLLFYLSLGKVQYRWVETQVVRYREGNASLMQDVHGLESGYRHVVRWVRNHADISEDAKAVFAFKVRRIMVRTYARKRQWLSALRARLRRW